MKGNLFPLELLYSNAHTFSHFHFSDKFKPLQIDPYKILERLHDITYELLSQDGSTFHRNHLMTYYPKEPLSSPQLRNFMRCSDSIQYDIPKPINMLITIPPHSTEMIHFQMIHFLKKNFLQHNIIHHQILLFKTTLLLMTQDLNQLQKSINQILHIEHGIVLKLTYKFRLILVYDKLKPIIM